MRYMGSCLGYAELRNALRASYRNGRWDRCDNEGKALLRAAVCYTRRGLRIISDTVLAELCKVMRKLGVVNRVRILMDGEIKAAEMRSRCQQNGVFRWVPQLKIWLRDQTYKLWLGITQISLKEFHPMAGEEPG